MSLRITSVRIHGNAARVVVSSLLSALLIAAVPPAVSALDELPVPPPPGAVQIAFGVAGLAHLQTARLNVAAVGGGAPDPAGVCRVGLGFRDAGGQLFRDASGMDVAAELLVASGRAVSLDLREADAFRGRTGRRVAVRPEVRWLDPTSGPSPCGILVATLEIIDSLTGRTVLLNFASPDVVSSTEPDVPSFLFGLVGLHKVQTARLNVAAVGGGTPDASELPVCPFEVGFVDEMGEAFRDASGMPIVASGVVAAGQATYLELKAVDAFRETTGLRRAFRPAVRVLSAATDEPCVRPVPTLELFDTLTGRGNLLYAPPGVR